MAKIYDEISRTFNEYLLIPNLTKEENVVENISLETYFTKVEKGKKNLKLNIPIVSAIMQSVSNDTLAIALAREGGLSFIYGAQPIEEQAKMVRNVKNYKSGFVPCDSCLKLDNTLNDILALKEKHGHSTMAVTDNGERNGKLLGIVTSRDYRISKDDKNKKVKDIMTPFEKLIVGREGITLSEANDLLWNNKLNCVPIVDDNQNLCYLVFRKDYDEHKLNPLEFLDQEKSLMVGAGINTHDYKERVPALIDAGVDILCLDSSDGYSVWQKKTISYIKENYPDMYVGAGNVVDAEGFRYLVEAGADFVKVGIGGGSICITREQKGIGRGQATALIEVSKEREVF